MPTNTFATRAEQRRSKSTCGETPQENALREHTREEHSDDCTRSSTEFGDDGEAVVDRAIAHLPAARGDRTCDDADQTEGCGTRDAHPTEREERHQDDRPAQSPDGTERARRHRERDYDELSTEFHPREPTKATVFNRD